ncbi:hypothetical protein B9Z55_028668 [Caenorhabditis nigoni]|uniref:Uncharacterized protein n=1 Tax=Caenorhabditis nigoni TaxID=1611254 RepID=A0A2G5SAE3_9PELO|nr:hypothetical protein B9Z55_028667 [Caenorhabditis nigoni]PIC12045.1 hypothetical protein B9Z55_028668 [Caenorhabditis nigoni]
MRIPGSEEDRDFHDAITVDFKQKMTTITWQTSRLRCKNSKTTSLPLSSPMETDHLKNNNFQRSVWSEKFFKRSRSEGLHWITNGELHDLLDGSVIGREVLELTIQPLVK